VGHAARGMTAAWPRQGLVHGATRRPRGRVLAFLVLVAASLSPCACEAVVPWRTPGESPFPPEFGRVAMAWCVSLRCGSCSWLYVPSLRVLVPYISYCSPQTDAELSYVVSGIVAACVHVSLPRNGSSHEIGSLLRRTVLLAVPDALSAVVPIADGSSRSGIGPRLGLWALWVRAGLLQSCACRRSGFPNVVQGKAVAPCAAG
jgi:hypothetical protein